MNPSVNKKIKVFDCFLIFNELDLLEKRLELLYDTVDYFVIGESKTTFSGLEKPLYFLENRQRYERFKEKVIHYTIPESKKDVKKEVSDKYFTNETKRFFHKHNNLPVSKLRSSIQREIFQRDCGSSGRWVGWAVR
jgi:beta-1,4-mannosyl-glycoprotein beta-1,4-N-acetylglucosaminyltransferase